MNIQSEELVGKAKSLFNEMVLSFGSDPYHLRTHLQEAQKWAYYMTKKYPEADKEVILLAVWLHDIGHYPVPTDIDHSVRGECVARRFLKTESYSEDKMENVLHCVRAHRCRDVRPETLEARIIAFLDAASHMTDTMYLSMAKQVKEKDKDFDVYAKMERDFRELSLFPEIKEDLVELYESWKNLIKVYEKIEFK